MKERHEMIQLLPPRRGIRHPAISSGKMPKHFLPTGVARSGCGAGNQLKSAISYSGAMRETKQKNWDLRSTCVERRASHLLPNVRDVGELEERAEDEAEADVDPHICARSGYSTRESHTDRLDVGDGRELGVDTRRLRRHGEQRCHAQRHARRHCRSIEPERDPAHDHQHGRWRVHLHLNVSLDNLSRTPV